MNDLLQVSLICGYVFLSKALLQFNNGYHSSYENCLIMRGVILGSSFCLLYLLGMHELNQFVSASAHN